VIPRFDFWFVILFDNADFLDDGDQHLLSPRTRHTKGWLSQWPWKFIDCVSPSGVGALSGVSVPAGYLPATQNVGERIQI
jgi:hypothetical protein